MTLITIAGTPPTPSSMHRIVIGFCSRKYRNDRQKLSIRACGDSIVETAEAEKGKIKFQLRVYFRNLFEARVLSRGSAILTAAEELLHGAQCNIPSRGGHSLKAESCCWTGNCCIKCSLTKSFYDVLFPQSPLRAKGWR